MAQMESKMQEMVLESATVAKEDWLNTQVKSMEANVKVSGLHYRIKDYQRRSAAARLTWREEMIRRIFVDTNVVEESLLFDTNANGKKELKRVIRNMHPLGAKDRNQQVGPNIIVAFIESSLSNDIKERIRKDEGLIMKKDRKGKEEIIKITSHLPVILENLRNEALRERQAMKAASSGARKIILSESLRWPWVFLVEKDDNEKKPVAFKVEDNRLINPARTLAMNHLQGVRDFKPWNLLSEPEKVKIGTGAMTTAFNPNVRQENMEVQ